MTDEYGTELEVMEIARVEALIARYPRVLSRVFSPDEIAYCEPKRKAGQHFTARLAAKMAARRVLGGGMLSEFVVERDDRGAPSLRVSGRAADLNGEGVWLLSLSHDAGVATAFVARIESAS